MYDKKDLLGNVHEGFTESRNGTMIYLLSLNFIFLKKKKYSGIYQTFKLNFQYLGLDKQAT